MPIAIAMPIAERGSRAAAGPSRRVLGRRSTAGFTLVELLTVIAIIGVLMGLMMAAIGPVRRTVRTWALKSEVTQLTLGLERVRTELGGGEYPPDGTNKPDTTRYFKRAFPRATITTDMQTTLDSLTPATALAFWLGGMSDANGNFIGFSADPTNPLSATDTSRLGPFFDFDMSRVAGTGVNRTLIPKNDTPGTAPYVYFKAVGGQYSTSAVANATNAAAYMGKNNTWVNNQSFQLLCPGLDGKYGKPTSGASPLYPDGTNYAPETADDVTNFANSKVENDIP
jgi:prepilin-type N-terminal cleavage/methylation domain-containing protein